MDQRELAVEVERVTRLSSIQMEQEIGRLHDETHIIKVLADLLAYDFPHQQKQMAAVAINQVVRLSLKSSQRQWPKVWRNYLSLLRHTEVEAINWRHLKITQCACIALLEEFAEQLCSIVNPIMPDLSLKPLTLAQTSQESKFVFFRENIEQILDTTYRFITNIHDEKVLQPDFQSLQSVLVENIEQVVKLKHMTCQPLKEFLFLLSRNQELFFIIIEELLYDPDCRHYESIIKREFSPERMAELRFSLDGGSEKQFRYEDINDNKARALNMLTESLGRYRQNSGSSDFQSDKYLYLLSKMIPYVMDHLVVMLGKSYESEEEEFRSFGCFENMVGLMGIIRKAYSFEYLLGDLENMRESILFRIVLPCLESTKEEYGEFRDSPETFYGMAEDLVENIETKREPSVKSIASELLESMINSMPDLLRILVEFSVWQIRFKLTGQNNSQGQMVLDKFKYRPCVERALMVLAMLADRYSARPDITRFIRNQLFGLPELISLTGIDKARLFILLAYVYENFFMDYADDGIKYLKLADECMEVGGSIGYSAEVLFFNCLKVGFGIDIWESLVKRIRGSETYHIFGIMKKIVNKMLPKLQSELVTDMLMELKGRMITQFQKCKVVDGDKQIYRASPRLLQCLDIMCQLSQQAGEIRKRPELIDAMWQTFDLFDYISRLEFEENILTIFTNLLNNADRIDYRYFQYFGAFAKVYQKTGTFQLLFKPYCLLLLRGRNHFMSGQEAVQDLQQLLGSVREAYGLMRSAESLKIMCILHHFAYNQYSSLFPHRPIFIDKLIELYHEPPFELPDQTRAAIINCVMTADWAWGQCDWSMINGNSISIFRGYQGRVFSHTLRRLIESQFQSNKIILYFKYLIRLLHFWRELSRRQAPDSHSLVPKIFDNYSTLDPFQEVSKSLDFVKARLQPRRYDQILDELSTEVELGEVKDLLSRRVVHQSTRTFVHVKRDY